VAFYQGARRFEVITTFGLGFYLQRPSYTRGEGARVVIDRRARKIPSSDIDLRCCHDMVMLCLGCVCCAVNECLTSADTEELITSSYPPV
jgi:hypothetical protein